MANKCSIKMKVIGDKRDVKTFLNILKNKNEIGPHMYKLSIHDHEIISDNILILNGYCDWSIAHGLRKKPLEVGACSIDDLSKDFNLIIEIYGTEQGVGFEEHLIVDNGVVKTNDQRQIITHETELYRNAKEFNDIHNTDVTQDEFEMSSEIVLGGYGDQEFTI